MIAWLMLGMLAASPVDIVLVLEDSPGMQEALASTRIPVFQPETRAALVTFSRKVKVRQQLTGDRQLLDRAVRRLAPRIHMGPAVGSRPDAHIFDAIAAACKLFPADPGRRRAIILLFGSEDWGDPSAARAALQSGHVTLYAASVRRRDPARWVDPKTQTPPTIPGRIPPVPTDRAPLPEATAKRITDVAKETGGEIETGAWNLQRLWALLKK